MNATLTLSILLGAGALVTSVFGLVTTFRDRGRSIRKQEGDLTKLEGTIRLDRTERDRIAAEAAQINSDVAIAQQNWWRENFGYLRAELVEEQRLRRRLTKWADAHQTWDEQAWNLSRLTDPDFPPPPRLEHD